MAIFRAPPNQNDLVLNRGDILNVFDGGAATNTVINAGGLEQVFAGGTSENTIINAIGSEILRGAAEAQASALPALTSWPRNGKRKRAPRRCGQ